MRLPAERLKGTASEIEHRRFLLLRNDVAKIHCRVLVDTQHVLIAEHHGSTAEGACSDTIMRAKRLVEDATLPCTLALYGDFAVDRIKLPHGRTLLCCRTPCLQSDDKQQSSSQ